MAPRLRNKRIDVDTINANVQGVADERVNLLQKTTAFKLDISSRIQKRIAKCKQTIESSGSGTKRAHGAAINKPTADPVFRSPVTKKQRKEEEEEKQIVETIKLMNKMELKSELKSRGLAVAGVKAELAERLIEAVLTTVTTACSEPASEAVSVHGDAKLEAAMEETLVPLTKSMHKVQGGGDTSHLLRETETMIISPIKPQSSPCTHMQSDVVYPSPVNNKQKPDTKPVAELKQLFERGNATTVEDLDGLKENLATSRVENDQKQSRSPIKAVKSAMENAINALSGDTARPKSPFHKQYQSEDPKHSEDRSGLSSIKAGAKAGLMGTKLCAFPTGKAGTLSESAQAKRRQHLENMKVIREKSKPASSAQNTLRLPQLSSLSALSAVNGAGKSEDGKRRLADMRAKAGIQKQPLSSKCHAIAIQPGNAIKTGKLESATPSASSIFSSHLASPDASCQYEISDKDDTDSESESDDENGNGKRVPNWVNPHKLNSKLKDQIRPGALDPDAIFGEVETCNLGEIFDNPRTRFKKRTSSGNWGKDRATAGEKLAYKRRMRYGNGV